MVNNAFSDLEHLALVARRLSQAGIDITGNYHDWILVTLGCASLGEAARESYHTICSMYPRYTREECNQKFDNCLKTGDGSIRIATVIQMAKNAGIDVSLPKGRRPKTEEQLEEEQRTLFVNASNLLKKWAVWRYNTWSNRVEIQEPGGECRPIQDRDISTYYCRLKEAGVRISAKDVEHLIVSRDFATDYNPFTRYFDCLPNWQEGDRDYIHDFFVGHMEFDDPEFTDFYDQMFRKWFVGAVALWLGRVDENPIVPVLYGEQHIGKTYFVRHILPPELQSYLFPVNPAVRVDKDFEISMSETPIMFLDEFSVSNLQKSEAYKYAVTSSKSYLRDSYGHHREMRQRRASLIAATNHEKFIRDSEGIRRYLAVRLNGTKNLNEYPLPYEGAYAQALYLLNHGFQPKPNQQESKLITEHSRAHVMNDDVTEALQTFVRHPEEKDIAQAYSAGDLQLELSIRGFHGNVFNAVNIGKAMKGMGFMMRKIKGNNKYLVVLVDYEHQKLERIADAKEIQRHTETIIPEAVPPKENNIQEEIPF